MVLVSGNFAKFREIQNILVKNLVFSEILKLLFRSHALIRTADVNWPKKRSLLII